MSARSCSRATRVFFKRHANLAKEAAHHRGVGFDPSLGRKAIAKSLKRDVRLLGPRGLQKITVRHQLGRPVAAAPDRLSGAVPFNPFKPLDRHGFADFVAPRRRRAGSSRPSSPRQSRDHANLANKASAFPAGLRPANRLMMWTPPHRPAAMMPIGPKRDRERLQ